MENSIGVLWLNEGENGEYLAGKITIEGVTTSIVVFKNNYKNSDKHPDYKIFLSDRQEQASAPPSAHQDVKDELEPF